MKKEEMPVWSARLELGLQSIDEQHRKLFELAATFGGSGDQVRVMKTLVALCDYTREHFREEEYMLAAHGYPDLQAHKIEHAKFRGMLVDLLIKAKSQSLDQTADDVRQLIGGWMYEHIMQRDLDYLPFINGKKSGSGRMVCQ